jgi:hypothetical protein
MALSREGLAGSRSRSRGRRCRSAQLTPFPLQRKLKPEDSLYLV